MLVILIKNCIYKNSINWWNCWPFYRILCTRSFWYCIFLYVAFVLVFSRKTVGLKISSRKNNYIFSDNIVSPEFNYKTIPHKFKLFAYYTQLLRVRVMIIKIKIKIHSFEWTRVLLKQTLIVITYLRKEVALSVMAQALLYNEIT